MTDLLVVYQLEELVLEVVNKEEAYGIEECAECKGLSRIEFGILSWHLGSFYCCPERAQPN